MPLEKNQWVSHLLNWYDKHHRKLPWRETQDPYKIWLSEIILQQTRVNQGLPYYKAFVAAFPTIQDLAAAPQEKVLRLWQGLGYYSRARNLHFCAQQVVNDYDGKFPQTYKELLQLKGIGKYTAAAIASFAFGEAVPTVDGNVMRFLARFLGIEEDIAAPKSFRLFFEAGQAVIPKEQAGNFNQAMMEFGALQCTPKNPDCMFCPLSESCYAFHQGKQQQLPIKKKKVKVRNRFFHYLVLHQGDEVWMKQRGSGDIWEGLYDFPNIEAEAPLDWKSILQKCEEEPTLQAKDWELLDDGYHQKHILSHQKIHARFFRVAIPPLPKKEAELLLESQRFKRNKLYDLPKPILVSNYLDSEF